MALQQSKSFTRERNFVMRAISINGFRISEENFESQLKTFNQVFKNHFVNELESSENPILSAGDISIIFFSTTDTETNNQRLLSIIRNFKETDTICSSLQDFFDDV